MPIYIRQLIIALLYAHSCLGSNMIQLGILNWLPLFGAWKWLDIVEFDAKN
jgi:hypothetical protein